MLVTTISTTNAHMNSSAPGDFAETESSIIFSDIYANLGVASICIFVIGLIYYAMMKSLVKEYSTTFNQQRVSAFFRTLFIFNLLILFSLPVIGNISYWKERSPYFPKTSTHSASNAVAAPTSNPRAK